MALPKSDDEILLLHNPKCSKSRATLALLEERNVSFQTRRYLEDPLSGDELRELARRLGRPVGGFTRRGQSEFIESGLGEDSTEDQIVEAMVETPILMERPILLRGDRAVVGRPPEDVLRLLDD